jgi:hypothetical protein
VVCGVPAPHDEPPEAEAETEVPCPSSAPEDSGASSTSEGAAGGEVTAGLPPSEMEGEVQVQAGGKGPFCSVHMALRGVTLTQRPAASDRGTPTVGSAAMCRVSFPNKPREGHENAFRLDLFRPDSGGISKYIVSPGAEGSQLAAQERWMAALGRVSLLREDLRPALDDEVLAMLRLATSEVLAPPPREAVKGLVGTLRRDAVGRAPEQPSSSDATSGELGAGPGAGTGLGPEGRFAMLEWLRRRLVESEEVVVKHKTLVTMTLLAEGAPVLLGSLQAAEAQQCALEVGCMASFSAPDDPDLGDKP